MQLRYVEISNVCAFIRFLVCNPAPGGLQTADPGSTHDEQAWWVEQHSHTASFAVNILEEKKEKSVSLLKRKLEAISTKYKYYANRWKKFFNISGSLWWFGFGRWSWMAVWFILVSVSVSQTTALKLHCQEQRLQGSTVSSLGADPPSVSEQSSHSLQCELFPNNRHQQNMQINSPSNWKCFFRSIEFRFMPKNWEQRIFILNPGFYYYMKEIWKFKALHTVSSIWAVRLFFFFF